MAFDGLHKLIQYIDFKEKQDIDYHLALNLIENQSMIYLTTINEMAEKCFVSVSTLSRFVNKLGFESYGEFRESFKYQYYFENDYPGLFQANKSFRFKQAVSHLSEIISEEIQETYNLINEDQLNRIVKKIHDSTDVSFYALNIQQHIAADFQTRLAKLGKLSYAFNSFDKQDHQAQQASRESVAIFISMHGRSLYFRKHILEQLKEKGTYIVIITQLDSEFAALYADEIIVASGNSNIDTGRFTLIYILECLLMKYYELYLNEIKQQRKRISNTKI